MAKYYYFLFFSIVLLLNANGQTISIVDEENNTPIADVLLYDESQTISIKSDENGKADISALINAKFITFQHPSFQVKVLTPQDINLLNNTVSLSPSIFEMEELVISANRWKQDAKDIPNQIVSISPKNVLEKNPQTAADLLSQSGEVFVQKSQLGGGSPMMRGFAANKVLLSVEGVRMNNAIFRGGNLQNIINIDPNTLESAEVIFGPGSVLYGSDALGGVMNFMLITPEVNTETPYVIGQSLLRYSSANNEKTGNIKFETGGKKWGFFLSFTYSSFDDLVTGDKRTDKFPDFGKRPEYVQRINGEDRMVQNAEYNQQKFSGFDQQNISGKIRFQPNKHLDLSYTAIRNTTSNIPRYDRLIEYDDNAVLKKAEWYYGPQQWDFHKLEAMITKNHLLFNHFRTTLSYQHFKETRHNRNFGDDRLRNQIENVGVFGINLDLEKELNKSATFFYGFEAITNDVKSEAYQNNIETNEITPYDTRYPDGGSKYNSLAVYSTYNNRLNEKLLFNAGIRFSWINLNAKLSDQSSLDFNYDELILKNQALNGSLGLVYNLQKNTSIYANIATGFRAPNLDDVGKIFESSGDNVFVPNPDLKPEHTLSGEIGSKVLVNEKIRANISGFYTSYTDAIVDGNYQFNGQDSILYEGKMQNVMAKVNTGEAYIYGFSALVDWKIAKYLNFNSSLTYTQGRDKGNNEPLRHTTPLFGKSALVFAKGNIRTEFNALYNGKRSLEDMPASEASKNHLYTADGSLAWYTLNFYSSYAFNDFIKATASVENIMDQHYRTYSSGISAPGRNFIVTVLLGINK